MKKVCVFCFLILCIALNVRAQYNLPQSRIWAMGNKVGLDFTVLTNPTPITTSLANTNEAAASICDTSGNLLFYTNGSVVWDRSGVQMPNAGALTGTVGSTLSTTQGAVIVPMADSAGKYYIFSLTQVSNCKLYCNKIDMSLNGGMGDVDITFHQIDSSLSDSFLTEKMTVTPGCGNSVWLIVHTQNSPVFRAYNVTSTGINLTPVLSVVGAFGGDHYQQGVMKFSPDGTKLLNCNFRSSAPGDAGIEVFDFDRVTGVLSNGIVLNDSSFYGGTFSPDGTKVYAEGTFNSKVCQWDLTASVPSASEVVLGSSGQYTDLKLGPDGKIYFGALAGSPGYSQYRYMGRVNVPNNAGPACMFQDSVTSLIFPAASGPYGALSQGMPNDVAVPVPSVNTYQLRLDTVICSPLTSFVLNAPTGYTSMLWDNSTTASSRTVSARGTYWVQSTSACNSRVDTFRLAGADMPALTISYASHLLTATPGFSSYTWYQNGVLISGAVTNTYTATGNNIYSVYGNYGSGCSDSTFYTVTGFTTTGVNSLYTGAVPVLYPNPANDVIHISYSEPVNVLIQSMEGEKILFEANTLNVNVGNLAAGLYLVTLTDNTGIRLSTQKLIKK